VKGSLSPGVEQPEREVDLSPPSSAQAKNIPIVPCTFTASPGTKLPLPLLLPYPKLANKDVKMDAYLVFSLS
jgi:hypothetical protein